MTMKIPGQGEEIGERMRRASQASQTSEMEGIKMTLEAFFADRIFDFQAEVFRPANILPDTRGNGIPQPQTPGQPEESVVIEFFLPEKSRRKAVPVGEAADFKVIEPASFAAPVEDFGKFFEDRFFLALLKMGGEQEAAVFRERLGNEPPAADQAAMKKTRKSGQDLGGPGVSPVIRPQAVDLFDRSLEPGEMSEPAAAMRKNERIPGFGHSILPGNPAVASHSIRPRIG